MVYEEVSRKFIGLNVFGIRLKHAVMDKWLNEERSIDYVAENLRTANFDPEFYKGYESDVISKYNSDQGTHIKIQKSVGLFSFLTQ